MTHFPLVRPLAVAVLCVSGAFVAGAAGSGAPGQRTPNQQRAVISVVDKKGAPVANLTPGDLTIKEDGVAREVLKVEPATDAMEIAILVDTSAASTGTITDLRNSIKAFAVAVWDKSPDTQIALYTFGERPTLEADFSSSAINLNRRADRLFAASGSGAYFIDAVIEASAVLKKRAGARPGLQTPGRCGGC